jgi:GTP pyrophosphokinase
MSAKWIDSSKQEFKAILKIFGEDHVGMVNEITQIISKNMSVNIQGLNISGHDGIFEGKITVSVKNKSQLQELSDTIKQIEGIETVERIYKH